MTSKPRIYQAVSKHNRPRRPLVFGVPVSIDVDEVKPKTNSVYFDWNSRDLLNVPSSIH